MVLRHFDNKNEGIFCSSVIKRRKQDRRPKENNEEPKHGGSRKATAKTMACTLHETGRYKKFLSKGMTT